MKIIPHNSAHSLTTAQPWIPCGCPMSWASSRPVLARTSLSYHRVTAIYGSLDPLRRREMHVFAADTLGLSTFCGLRTHAASSGSPRAGSKPGARLPGGGGSASFTPTKAAVVPWRRDVGEATYKRWNARPNATPRPPCVAARSKHPSHGVETRRAPSGEPGSAIFWGCSVVSLVPRAMKRHHLRSRAGVGDSGML